jgi:hypothetical protein
VQAVLVATVGSTPCAVAGSEVHVAGEDGLTRNMEHIEEGRSSSGSPVRPSCRGGGGTCSRADMLELKGQ